MTALEAVKLLHDKCHYLDRDDLADIVAELSAAILGLYGEDGYDASSAFTVIADIADALVAP